MKDTLIGLAAIAMIILFFVKVSTIMPGSATVALDPRSQTYASSACVANDVWERLETTTKDAARQRGYKANKDCANMGGFTQDTRLILSLLGVRPSWD